jgi:regulator of replication initiation timing
VHVVTKILVVVAAVLAILLSGLTIAYTNNADRVTSELTRAESALEAAKASAAQAETRAAAELEPANTQINALNSQLSDLQSGLQTLRADLVSVREENRSYELELQNYASRIDQFQALQDEANALIRSAQDQLVDVRGAYNDEIRRNIELTDRITDLTSQLEVVQEENRALQEELADATRDGGSGVGPGGETGVTMAPADFRARVTNVIRDEDGTTLVQLNAGSSDMLRERMTLVVTRGAQYLGTIEVLRVDLNDAVARVTLRPAGEPAIRANDTVRSRRPGA